MINKYKVVTNGLLTYNPLIHAESKEQADKIFNEMMREIASENSFRIGYYDFLMHFKDYKIVLVDENIKIDKRIEVKATLDRVEKELYDLLKTSELYSFAEDHMYLRDDCEIKTDYKTLYEMLKDVIRAKFIMERI